MPKKHDQISDAVMDRIKEEKITMRPKWYFVVGSLAMSIGIALSLVMGVVAFRLVLMAIRARGVMAQYRMEALVSALPVWVPIVGVLALVVGFLLLRRSDLSYKTNFPAVVAGIILSVLLAAMLIDKTGLDAPLLERGPMRELYRQSVGNVGSGSAVPRPGSQMETPGTRVERPGQGLNAPFPDEASPSAGQGKQNNRFFNRQ